MKAFACNRVKLSILSSMSLIFVHKVVVRCLPLSSLRCTWGLLLRKCLFLPVAKPLLNVMFIICAYSSQNTNGFCLPYVQCLAHHGLKAESTPRDLAKAQVGLVVLLQRICACALNGARLLGIDCLKRCAWLLYHTWLGCKLIGCSRRSVPQPFAKGFSALPSSDAMGVGQDMLFPYAHGRPSLQCTS